MGALSIVQPPELSRSPIVQLTVVHFLSPGPDFFVVLRSSLVYSRKNGLITACGVSAALIVHLFYTFVGIAVLIEESAFAFSCIKVVGAAYLCYIGLKGIGPPLR